MKVNRSSQNIKNYKNEQNINFKAQSLPITQINDNDLKLTSGAITSLGIASLAINQKKNDKFEDSEYEECPEVVEGMSRFTPEELDEFSKHENYKNIELLSTLKLTTPEGKEEYRYNAKEILQLANIKDFSNFFVLAQKEYRDPQTKKYQTRFSNSALDCFVRNKINFSLALDFSEIIKDINTWII